LEANNNKTRNIASGSVILKADTTSVKHKTLVWASAVVKGANPAPERFTSPANKAIFYKTKQWISQECRRMRLK
jgi:hypothetical protein